MSNEFKPKITQEQWDAYLAVQRSGLTNMFFVENVCDYALELTDIELTKKDCIHVMEHYNDLEEHFGYSMHKEDA